MNILLFGKNGQLGWELRRTLSHQGNVVAVDYEDLDLVDADALSRKITEAEPALIVNASAYTDVDAAESEQEKAFAINARAPQIMAEHAKQLGAFLVHYSTDYVFDGKKGSPYVETDSTSPAQCIWKQQGRR